MKRLSKIVIPFVALSILQHSASAQNNEFEVDAFVSSEFEPMNSRWYTNPWPESAIPRKLDSLGPLRLTKLGSNNGILIDVNPNQRFQEILGIGSSLEHTTVYAIRKNKSSAQQREVLRALIDPVTGAGMNLFRVTIGTSDFADGTRATPKPSHPQGWYTYQDSPNATFSIERDRSLGIIDTVKMAIDVGKASNNALKIVGSAWSPPAWMREGNKLVGGGPLKADMLDDYAAYLRKFVEAYQNEGIPIYAITMQNERQFEPGAYPGMVISWQMERDLLIEVYENFNNIGGNYGQKLDVKLWTLDHNFDYWEQSRDQIASLKNMGKAHYLDATAFHHYGGNSENMSQLHDAHPDKSVVFTEGTVWGLSADGNRRSYEAVLRHFRNWTTGYMSWVTMTTQTLDEANKGPYNSVGSLDPTMIVKNDGNNPNWYRTPEYWLMAQFSKFIRPGARRIESNYGSRTSVTNVAFLNPDGYVVLVVANSTGAEQVFDVVTEGNQISASIPARSIATYRWKSGLGQSPHPWVPRPEPQQDPYNAQPVSIPGTIQAEEYDLGGQNVAYSDNSIGNNGNGLRNDNVDIEANSSGFHVGWLESGEWMEYTVNVTKAGTYDLVVRHASDGVGGSFQLQVDGDSVSPVVTTNNTGGWKAFKNLRSGPVQLKAGEQVIRLLIEQGEFNIDYIRIEEPDGSPPVSPCEQDAVSIPNNRIQAENYCQMSGVREEDTADVGGGENIGYIDSGDWAEYGINVSQSGEYTLKARVASQAGGGEIEYRVDGGVVGRTSVPSTGGWQNWQNVEVDFALSAGFHTLRLNFRSGGLNLNWMEIKPKQSTPPPSSGAIQEGTYIIENKLKRSVLDVAGRSTNNGANVQLWSATGNSNQQWQVVAVSNGAFEIRSVGSGACLDADSGSDNVHQWACVGNQNQRWVIEASSGGTYRVRTLSGNEYLEADSNASMNGANVRTRSGSGGDNKKWIFKRL